MRFHPWKCKAYVKTQRVTCGDREELDVGFLLGLCVCRGWESGQMSHQQRRPRATISLIHSQPDVIMWTHLARNSAHVSQFITSVYRMVMWLNYGGLNDWKVRTEASMKLRLHGSRKWWSRYVRVDSSETSFPVRLHVTLLLRLRLDVTDPLCLVIMFLETFAIISAKHMLIIRKLLKWENVILAATSHPSICFLFYVQHSGQEPKLKNTRKSGFWFSRTLAWIKT